MTDFQGSDILKSLHITDSRAKQGNRVRGRLDCSSVARVWLLVEAGWNIVSSSDSALLQIRRWLSDCLAFVCTTGTKILERVKNPVLVFRPSYFSLDDLALQTKSDETLCSGRSRNFRRILRNELLRARIPWIWSIINWFVSEQFVVSRRCAFW